MFSTTLCFLLLKWKIRFRRNVSPLKLHYMLLLPLTLESQMINSCTDFIILQVISSQLKIASGHIIEIVHKDTRQLIKRSRKQSFALFKPPQKRLELYIYVIVKNIPWSWAVVPTDTRSDLCALVILDPGYNPETCSLWVVLQSTMLVASKKNIHATTEIE